MVKTLRPPRLDVSRRTQPVLKGGTGVDKVSDIAQKLSIVTNSEKNQNNGVASLNASSKLTASKLPIIAGSNNVNISGNLTVNINATTQFVITDYDVFRTYTVTANVGTVSRTGDTISYTAPPTVQAVSLTINGRVIPLTLVDPTPQQPSITSPTNGSTGLGLNIPVTSSAYSNSDGSVTHQSTDWQVSSNVSFTGIVASSIDDTVNKVSWTIPNNLSVSTTYYLRCRYKGSNGLYSPYSSTISFTTKASFYPTTEEAKLVANDKAASDFLGTNCAISDDGTRVVITALGSDPGGTNLAGAAYIFLRTGSSWSQETKIFSSDKVADDQFGFSVDMDATGTRVVVGVKESDPGGTTGAGAAYIYVRSGTTWSQEQKIFASDKTTSDQLGYSVAIDSTGTRVACGARSADAGATASAGAVYIFTRSGSVWTQEQKVVASDATSNASFGNAVSLDENATRLLIGAYAEDTTASDSGAAYIFLRSGTTWTQEQKLKLPAPVASDWFGYSVSISSTGIFAAISASLYEAGGLSNSGTVLIYKRSGSVWSFLDSLMASDKAAADQYGYCVSLNSDASILVVSTPVKTVSSISGAGCVYIWSRNTSTDAWTQRAIISASDKAASDQFGYSLDIARTNNRIIVGANFSDPGGTTQAGAGYIFS